MSTMITIELDVELLTDACLSTSNRTLGEPETFTCIPGRTLWGAIASRAYRCGMPEAEAFRVFHQGGVRIQDAVPVSGDRRSYPIPRSWQRPKDDQAAEVRNFALETERDASQGTQCKPLGEGWVVPDGAGACTVEMKTSRSMRTSMDPSGSPRDGLLFGIPVIQAGARFWTAVHGPAADAEAVVKHLTSGDIRVGRSRNAEMGLIRVTRRKSPIQTVSSSSEKANRVSFLCVSRCLLRDPGTGSPTTVPFAEAFGLDRTWTFDEASSFTRTARIVHFNAKRARPESDRFALERGSVVTFKSPGASVDVAAITAHVQGGIGEHRGQGYGEVLVAPSWLTIPKLTVQKPEKQAVPVTVKAAEPTDELFRWAQKRSQDRNAVVDLYKTAREAAKQLRKYHVPPAQWGDIHKMAREARFNDKAADLWRKLFGDPDQKPTPQAYPSTSDRVPRGAGGHLGSGQRKLSREWKNARPCLLGLCEKHKTTPGQLAIFLEHVAGSCMRETAEMEPKS